MTEEQYVEAIFELAEGADAPSVERWLIDRGLQPIPMRAGLLVTGTESAFRSAFGVELRRARPPVRLDLPAELADHVSSATIPPPRRTREEGS